MGSPPGITFLLRRLPNLLLPPTILYLVCNVIQVHLANWLFILFAVLSLPAGFAVSVLYADYVNARRAASLGAVLPLQIPSKLPGGLSTLKTLIRNFQMGIPGEHCAFISHVYQLRLCRWYHNRIYRKIWKYI